jgi:hypothetical protein
MNKKIALLLSISFMFFLVIGCAYESRLKMDYGTSFNLSKFNQIFDPDAEKNLEPVEGINGRIAQTSADRYQKSFERPAQPPTYSIAVRGVGMGGGIQY